MARTATSRPRPNRPIAPVLLVAMASLVGNLAHAAVPTWNPVSLLPREDFVMIHDDVRHRLVLFGGWDGAGELDETRVLSLNGQEREWIPALTGSRPPRRRGHVAIYDPSGDRMIVYGGRGEGVLRTDVWALSLATLRWTQLPSSGGPGGYDQTAVYDPGGNRMILFGGYDGVAFSDQVWTYSLSTLTWAQLSVAAGPSGRMRHAAAFDPVRNRMVVVGGENEDGLGDRVVLDDAWALTLSGSPAWSALTNHPIAVTDHAALYDAPRDQMVVFGGERLVGAVTEYGVAWVSRLRLSDATWSYDPASPNFIRPIRSSVGAAIAKTATNAMAVVGGRADATHRLSDAFTYDFSGGVSPITPAPLAFQTAILNPADDRGMFQGGWYGEPVGAYWRIDAEGVPCCYADFGQYWYGSATVYDAPRGRFVSYGGRGGGWIGSGTTSLTWSGYSALQTSTAPAPPRFDHSAVYDAARQRMVVYGGRVSPSSFAGKSDLWALDLSVTPVRWDQLTPINAGPGARFGHRAILDPTGQKMILYGGFQGVHLGDVWELDLATLAWTQRTPAGPAPTPRAWPSLVLDTSRGRGILFGGQDASGPSAETWMLDLSGGMAWTQVSTPTAPDARYGHVAYYFPNRDHVVVHGGVTTGDWNLNDSWVLYLENVVGVSDALPSRVRVSAPAPNPATGGSSVALELPAAADVSVEVVDVAGRLVSEIARGGKAAGIHRFAWDGSGPSRRRAAPGLYFYRVTAGGERFARKVLLVP